MSFNKPTLDEIHGYIQSFQIEAILDRADGSIKTEHFLIQQMRDGSYRVTERQVEMQFMKTRIVAREISEKRQKV